MRRRTMACTLVSLLILALAACGAAPPTMTPTPTPPPPPTMTPVPPKLAQLATQRARWQALGITDYDIVVRETHAFSLVYLSTVIVRGGRVQTQSASCSGPVGSSGSCPNAARYTVPWLFAEAEAYLDGTRTRQLGIRTTNATQADGTTVTYDATYGFPYSITWDLPDVYDEQVTIRIASFTRPGPATPSPTTPERL